MKLAKAERREAQRRRRQYGHRTTNVGLKVVQQALAAKAKAR